MLSLACGDNQLMKSSTWIGVVFDYIIALGQIGSSLLRARLSLVFFFLEFLS